jgi:hypothetical protein
VKGIVKWEHTLDTELDGSMLFNDIYRITNDTKLRNFQFKFLYHILPNNKLLHKMGIKNSALCNFCNQEEDLATRNKNGTIVCKELSSEKIPKTVSFGDNSETSKSKADESQILNEVQNLFATGAAPQIVLDGVFFLVTEIT